MGHVSLSFLAIPECRHHWIVADPDGCIVAQESCQPSGGRNITVASVPSVAGSCTSCACLQIYSLSTGSHPCMQDTVGPQAAGCCSPDLPQGLSAAGVPGSCGQRLRLLTLFCCRHPGTSGCQRTRWLPGTSRCQPCCAHHGRPGCQRTRWQPATLCCQLCCGYPATLQGLGSAPAAQAALQRGRRGALQAHREATWSLPFDTSKQAGSCCMH